MSETVYPNYRTSTVTLTGQGFTAPVAVPARYMRQGLTVLLALPTIEGASNASTFTLEGLPAGLTPAALTLQIVRILDNSVVRAGLLVLRAGSRVIEVYARPDGDDFVPVGRKGLAGCVVPYVCLPGEG